MSFHLFTWFLLTCFGLFTLYRIVFYLFEEKILAKEQFEKWNMGFLFCFLFISWIFKSSFLLWTFHFLSFVVILFLLGWGAYISRRKKFRDHLIIVLRHTLLMMQSGFSFREAFKSSLSHYKGPLGTLFANIFHFMAFPQENPYGDPFTLEIIKDLQEIDQLPMNPMDNIRLLCHRLELIRKFEEKSHRVLYQIRFQSALMTIFFTGLTIYVLFSFPLREVILLVTVASLLFVSGLLWVFLDGRRIRWKI